MRTLLGPTFLSAQFLYSHMSKLVQFLIRNRYQFLQSAICLALLILPLLFWGDKKIVGGDDTRLYYFYPLDFLRNYATSIVGDNHIGGLGYYFPLSQFWPTLLLIALWNTIFSPGYSQFLLFGAVLAVGYLGFYYFLSNWLTKETPANRASRIVGGLMYVLSTFLYFTLFGALWPGIFLIAAMPWCIHFLVQSIRGTSWSGTVLSAVILALFANVIANLPWIAALALVLLPVLIILFVKHKKNFVIRLFVFGLLYCAISILPLFHFVYAPLSASAGDLNPVARVSKNTDEDIRQNEQLIRSVSMSNSVLFPMYNLFHEGIQKDFKWASYDVYKSWDLVLLPFNVLFLLIILFALLRIKAADQRYWWLTGGLMGWVLALFMFTANVTPYGLNIFIALNKHVPGFSMFRNMFDKFGLGLAFVFAFTVALALSVVIEAWQARHKGLVASALALIVLGAVPFLAGSNFQQPFRSTASKYDTLNDFNQDYKDLLSYIDSIPGSGRFAWIPLASGNYLPIQDSISPDHYYVGPSPVKILTSKNDYTGGYSFFAEGESLMKNLLLQGKYQEAAVFLQKMNVEYLIVNHDVDAGWQKSYLYQIQYPGDLFEAQGTEFKRAVLGNKLRSFGSRYDVYEINPAYRNTKISIRQVDSADVTSAVPASYKKISSDHYTATVNLSGEKDILFLETYQKLWKMRARATDGSLVEIDAPHTVALGYANAWRINATKLPDNLGKQNLDGSVTLDVDLRFVPATFSTPLALVSAGSLLFCLLYIAWSALPRQHRKKERP